jgi:hypothetical protein
MAADKSDDGTRRSDGISDLIKGAISTGVKSVLVTEEGVRGLLGDFIPKEISATVKAHLDGLKKEMYATFLKEFSQFLEKADIAQELRRFVSGMKVTVHAEIRFDEKGPVDAGRPRKRGRGRRKDAEGQSEGAGGSHVG